MVRGDGNQSNNLNLVVRNICNDWVCQRFNKSDIALVEECASISTISLILRSTIYITRENETSEKYTTGREYWNSFQKYRTLVSSALLEHRSLW